MLKTDGKENIDNYITQLILLINIKYQQLVYMNMTMLYLMPQLSWARDFDSKYFLGVCSPILRSDKSLSLVKSKSL